MCANASGAAKGMAWGPSAILGMASWRYGGMAIIAAEGTQAPSRMVRAWSGLVKSGRHGLGGSVLAVSVHHVHLTKREMCCQAVVLSPMQRLKEPSGCSIRAKRVHGSFRAKRVHLEPRGYTINIYSTSSMDEPSCFHF